MKYSTSHLTIRSAHLNNYYRNPKKPKQYPTSAKKKSKQIHRKKTDDSDDDENGTPKNGKQTPAKLKDSYVLQVADLATLEGLCRTFFMHIVLYIQQMASSDVHSMYILCTVLCTFDFQGPIK
jgi:hypothetical protein